MKPNSLLRILLVGLLMWTGTQLNAEVEQDLIATLQSGAGTPQKWAACQRLRVIGTAKAVPALAALLTEDGLSQAARYVLEALPGPEADAALRQALGKTSGLLKAGVIDSLGWRGEEQSVPLLAPLLLDSDPNIATAASSALGRIGGKEAIAALSASRDQVGVAVQLTLLESLLKCAERLAASKDMTGALAIYQDLFIAKYPAQIRTAAWRGQALSDSEHRAELIIKALQGTDHPVQIVALKLLRELNDKQVVQACVAQWASLTPEPQLAVLDAEVKLGAEALPFVHLASQSADLRLRVAAWQALGELNDTDSIPALAKAAVQGEPSERDAARESLERLDGPGASQALIVQAEGSSAGEKAELLRVLGERGDPAAANMLLQNAASDVGLVRQAALAALGRIAPLESAAPLLAMTTKAQSDEERDQLLAALYSVCEANPNKDQIGHTLVPMLERLPVAERRPLLPLLAQLGTADALAVAQAASRDADLELAKDGVRVLSQWPNAAPSGSLLELARSSTDPTLQTLALRGAIQVAGQEPDPAKRLALLKQAMAATKRVEEKRQVLGLLGQVPTPEALEEALKDLDEPGLTEEASLAALSIVEKLNPPRPDLANEAANKVLAQVQQGEVARRAWALQRKPGVSAPFIRDWLVSGPYRQAGVVGATAVFDIPFGPEKSGTNVEWKTVPPSDHVNLGALFPGQENCAAYLRTRIIAPQDCQGLLLIGSDDGVEAWLNGKIVHRNNVNRGEVADQDTVAISLHKGTNELMLKITQGGGGWSACARIVGTDFKPIPGVRIDGSPGRGPVGAL
jgi:HEAT repeat protein